MALNHTDANEVPKEAFEKPGNRFVLIKADFSSFGYRISPVTLGG
jgi:hypothetical protein